MKIFHCGNCDQLVFFENIACVNCGHTLGYVPDRTEIGTFEPAGPDLWRLLGDETQGKTYRLCANYRQHQVCNWVVPADDPNPFCRSCRLSRVIPDLTLPGTLALWAKLEAAKRRLLYSLLCLDLPLQNRAEDPERGLAFEFLANPVTPGAAAVLTGHTDGLITINIAEADDAEREMRRKLLNEPYRTPLGHFRHEIGHYYWDRLIQNGKHLEEFRTLFGDERPDYCEALARHHANGAPADWPNSFVSAYASCHPWEDWAETWAHYLHITDTLETSIACGLTLRPRRADEPSLKPDLNLNDKQPPSFDRMLERWFPLTYVLNNLNRGMGMPDAYPFVLPPPAIEKLRFVHKVIHAETAAPPERSRWNDYIKRIGAMSLFQLLIASRVLPFAGIGEQ